MPIASHGGGTHEGGRPSTYEVPPELQELLLEFTVSVLVERPSNLVNYAVDYFTNVRDSRLNSRPQTWTPDSDEQMVTDEDLSDEEPSQGKSASIKYPLWSKKR